MHTNCLFLLEFGGRGLFYEFYHDKTLKELLCTNGLVLCRNIPVVVILSDLVAKCQLGAVQV